MSMISFEDVDRLDYAESRQGDGYRVFDAWIRCSFTNAEEIRESSIVVLDVILSREKSLSTAGRSNRSKPYSPELMISNTAWCTEWNGVSR